MPGLRFNVRPGTMDGWIVREVERGIYTRFFPVLPTDTVADVGAHIGTFSVIAAKAALAGVVYSFEPQPSSFGMLLDNLELNGVSNDVPLNAAVGDAAGFTMVESHPPFNTGAVSTGRGDFSVPVVTLDETMPKLDFLKLDAEGAEIRVLQGAMRHLKGDVRIAAEVHSYRLRNQVVELLSELGYTTAQEAYLANTIVWAWKSPWA